MEVHRTAHITNIARTLLWGVRQGLESGTTEQVCSSAFGGVITGGGGFSTTYATPSWQTSQVAGYFTAAAKAGVTPYSGYKTGKRGYPDVSLTGVNYQTRNNGAWVQVCGTSASAPVMAGNPNIHFCFMIYIYFENHASLAGMLTLINTARLAAGKPPVGFVNPALYQIAASTPSAFNDITVGNNNCLIQISSQQTSGTATCCNQGFTAVAGWDPATGLGRCAAWPLPLPRYAARI